MWVCLNDAFLSIVHKDCKPDQLLVRARRPGDIERVFPGAKVRTSDVTDYRYRATVSRDDVAAALVNEVYGLSYGNFKDSVRENDLHHAYSQVWSVMYRMQPQPRNRRMASLFREDDERYDRRKFRSED